MRSLPKLCVSVVAMVLAASAWAQPVADPAPLTSANTEGARAQIAQAPVTQAAYTRVALADAGRRPTAARGAGAAEPPPHALSSDPSGWTTLLCGVLMAGFMARRRTRWLAD